MLLQLCAVLRCGNIAAESKVLRAVPTHSAPCSMPPVFRPSNLQLLVTLVFVFTTLVLTMTCSSRCTLTHTLLQFGGSFMLLVCKNQK